MPNTPSIINFAKILKNIEKQKKLYNSWHDKRKGHPMRDALSKYIEVGYYFLITVLTSS